MILSNLNRAVVRGLSVLLACCFFSVASVSADGSLSKVRALVYSQTAAEIQWSRNAGERVQLSYNNKVLGVLDSDSFYKGDLDPSQSHRFEVRSISSGDVLSAPVVLAFTTNDFKPPTREIKAQSAGDTSTAVSTEQTASPSAVLKNVGAQIYSPSAVELFWRRVASSSVKIAYNGQDMGRFDASSYYIDGLSASVNHRFDITALDISGNMIDSYVLNFSTADFSGSVRAIAADRVTLQGGVDGREEVATSEPAPEPVVAAAPETQPVSTPAPASTSTSNPAPAPEPVAENNSLRVDSVVTRVRNGDCVVRSLSDLSACVDSAQGITRINVQSDLSCSGSSCCPTGGALLRFDATNSLTIEGNGFRLLRQSGQRQCSLLDVTNSTDFTIRNWRLDDDSRVAPCVVADKCPRMVHIRNSRDVLLEQVSVSHGKSYTIYVQQVNGFGFINSRLQNSGVLGLYVGHSGKASTNVRIENSTFLDNQTNAVALLGVTGDSVATNTISNNVFKRNHWRGQWPVAPRYGSGFTGGGQVYIAEASGVTIRGNTIADGYCENCFVQQTYGSGVSGIEIAKPGQKSVRNLLITGNTIQNHDAWGIFVNQGSTVDGSVVVSNNRLLQNKVALKVSGAKVSGNTIKGR